jgi:hypothetical protein
MANTTIILTVILWCETLSLAPREKEGTRYNAASNFPDNYLDLKEKRKSFLCIISSGFPAKIL